MKKIAFFDSGVGGLTVFEKVKKLLPNEDYIYFGDTKNVPYGNKTNEELLNFTTEIFKFLEKQDVKAVVMACNTTSATVYEDLRKHFGFKIYPIIQSCAGFIAKLPIEKLGIFATKATINSGFYAKEINKYNPNIEIFEMACPEWVGIVEGNTKNENVGLIEKYVVKMLENKPDKIVLGCTHYPYLLDILGKFAPGGIFIDPSQYFADFIKADLAVNGLLKDNGAGGEKFFVSASPEKFKESSSMFYKLKELPELMEL
ncbi:MAG: glutamate racemase [Candidatus Gastranaerophilaceae bacterium]